MAKQDVVVSNYFKVPEHFCDFFNGTIFQGKEILKPEILEVMSEVSKESVPGSNRTVYVERRRDAIHKADLQGVYGVFAVDNQSEVHYGMPVRCMLYDALEYTRQIKEWKQKHKEAKDWNNSASYLSGMKKEDYLNPVFNLIFYYGEEPWDGEQCLSAMYRIPEELEPYKEYLPEYPIHLICPDNVNPENFRTEWKEIFELMQLSQDGEGMLRYAQEHSEQLQNMDGETKEFVMTMLHGAELWEEYEDKEEFDMCKAFEQIKEMGFYEGRETGKREGMRILVLDNLEEGKNAEEIIQKLKRRYELNEDEANTYYEKVMFDLA